MARLSAALVALICVASVGVVLCGQEFGVRGAVLARSDADLGRRVTEMVYMDRIRVDLDFDKLEFLSVEEECKCTALYDKGDKKSCKCKFLVKSTPSFGATTKKTLRVTVLRDGSDFVELKKYSIDGVTPSIYGEYKPLLFVDISDSRVTAIAGNAAACANAEDMKKLQLPSCANYKAEMIGCEDKDINGRCYLLTSCTESNGARRDIAAEVAAKDGQWKETRRMKINKGKIVQTRQWRALDINSDTGRPYRDLVLNSIISNYIDKCTPLPNMAFQYLVVNGASMESTTTIMLSDTANDFVAKYSKSTGEPQKNDYAEYRMGNIREHEVRLSLVDVGGNKDKITDAMTKAASQYNLERLRNFLSPIGALVATRGACKRDGSNECAFSNNEIDTCVKITVKGDSLDFVALTQWKFPNLDWGRLQSPMYDNTASFRDDVRASMIDMMVADQLSVGSDVDLQSTATVLVGCSTPGALEPLNCWFSGSATINGDSENQKKILVEFSSPSDLSSINGLKKYSLDTTNPKGKVVNPRSPQLRLADASSDDSQAIGVAVINFINYNNEKSWSFNGLKKIACETLDVKAPTKCFLVVRSNVVEESRAALLTVEVSKGYGVDTMSVNRAVVLQETPDEYNTSKKMPWKRILMWGGIVLGGLLLCIAVPVILFFIYHKLTTNKDHSYSRIDGDV